MCHGARLFPAVATQKTTAKTTALIPQARGGALRAGGKPGNRGGTGRPSALIRADLRDELARRPALLGAIMDGEPLQVIRVPLPSVLQHAKCPRCGDALTPEDVDTAAFVELRGTVSASPKDRIAAFDTAAKYGLGALKEISVENVRERVGATLDVIRQHCPPQQAAALINALRPVWV